MTTSSRMRSGRSTSSWLSSLMALGACETANPARSSRNCSWSRVTRSSSTMTTFLLLALATFPAEGDDVIGAVFTLEQHLDAAFGCIQDLGARSRQPHALLEGGERLLEGQAAALEALDHAAQPRQDLVESAEFIGVTAGGAGAGTWGDRRGGLFARHLLVFTPGGTAGQASAAFRFSFSISLTGRDSRALM